MREAPVVRKQVNETPVVRPKNFRENAFFNHPENYDFLMGNRSIAEIDNGLTLESPFSVQLLVVFTIALLIVVIGFISESLIAAIVGGIFAFVGGVGAYLLYERNLEEKTVRVTERLYTQGKVLEGKVVSCISSVEGGKYAQFYVDTLYYFVPPTGDPIQDRVKRVRSDLSGTVLPTQGTPVYILFLNHNEYYWL